MPFNFNLMQSYTLDYNDFYNELKDKPILSDRYVQDLYLNRWFQELKYLDNFLVSELNSKEAVLKAIDKIKEEPESFQFPIKFNCGTIYIHFRISYMNHLCKGIKGVLEPIESFVGPKQFIYWSPIDKNVANYSNVSNPIIVVPYINDKYSELVIDGNHRLTYAVNYKKSFISTVFLSADNICRSLGFSSAFDANFYIFYNEIALYSRLTEMGYKTEELLEKSYLSGYNPHLDELISLL